MEEDGSRRGAEPRELRVFGGVATPERFSVDEREPGRLEVAGGAATPRHYSKRGCLGRRNIKPRLCDRLRPEADAIEAGTVGRPADMDVAAGGFVASAH